jgi:outer membrane receptor for ferrienterochelin and colicins
MISSKDAYLFLGIVLLNFVGISAQEEVLDTVKVEKLNEVVVTAQYTPTSEKNAVYKVKVISKKVIEAKAVSNLTDLLRQELQMDFTFNPVFGAEVEINGVSKENIKFLIDGVPLIGRVNGVINLNQISLDNIKRIEVIEGPVSVFYGTDAMGGIINLITDKAQNKPLTANASILYESINNKNIGFDFGIKKGNNVLKFSGGYTLFDGLNTSADNVRSLSWPNRKNFYGKIIFNKKFKKFNINYTSNYTAELVKTLGEIKNNKANDIYYTTKRFDNSVNLQGSIAKNKYIDFTAAYLNYDRFDTSYKYDNDTGNSTLIENNPNENANYFDTFFSKIQFAKSSKSSNLNYAVGAEFQLDNGKGNRILNGKKKIFNQSFYMSANYKLMPNLEVQPAVRYTYNNVFKGLFSPAFNMKFHFNSQNTLRFAYANGFRSPSIKELYLDWHPTFGPFTYHITGNENLIVESSHNFNLFFTHTSLLKDGLLQIEPAVSYNKIFDLIGLSDMVNFSRHYINLNQMKTVNFTLNTKWQQNRNLRIGLGFSYLGRYIEYSNEFNSTSFMFTPSVSSSVFYRYKPLDINFYLFYKYLGKRKGHYIDDSLGADELIETTRNDFSNLDISVSKVFLKNKLLLQLGVKNIFDVKDVETYNQIGVAHERSNQLPGVNYFIKMNYKF